MDLTVAVCLCALLSGIAQANRDTHHSLSLSVPHLYYICPEGANVTLRCTLSGAKAHPNDKVHQMWHFTPHQDQHCHERIRSPPHHSNHSAEGVQFGIAKDSLWVTLKDVRRSDQGKYCCFAADFHVENHKPVVDQRARNHLLLTITPRRGRNDSLQCTVQDFKATDGSSSAAAGLATAACIMGILCLPFILFLVYKQRQGVLSNRRAHELVRMDSEARGHENPVYMGESPQTKTRTVSQILTRQSSETGRHLLADPGTPFTPQSNDNVFFHANEPIPESPDIMQV
ncbi:V-type immunoglobulin domain-containing suppressor of T-cell activation [Chanos chanos]|uniref:V-type immunoglobulin domain-containing suppressor of T-cell activation n=1 Tax=Chanos chanos TaxID=29144 RepID=UPI0011F2CD68|nr:V-type immunoglobulin domain-containing suppressor of T-cell activation [Chanos chanos]